MPHLWLLADSKQLLYNDYILYSGTIEKVFWSGQYCFGKVSNFLMRLEGFYSSGGGIYFMYTK